MSEPAALAAPPLDLTDRGASGRPQPVAAGGPYDPTRSQEQTRRGIAIAVVTVTAAPMLALAVLLLAGFGADGRVEKAAAVLLAPLLGFSGTVIGFSFGEKAGRAAKG